MRTAVLVTHTYPDHATEAVAEAARVAREYSVELVASPDERRKHGEAVTDLEQVEEMPKRPEVCLVLGGDGSILYALRHYAGTGVPVFGVNFGTVGFLAGAVLVIWPLFECDESGSKHHSLLHRLDEVARCG